MITLPFSRSVRWTAARTSATLMPDALQKPAMLKPAAARPVPPSLKLCLPSLAALLQRRALETLIDTPETRADLERHRTVSAARRAAKSVRNALRHTASG